MLVREEHLSSQVFLVTGDELSLNRLVVLLFFCSLFLSALEALSLFLSYIRRRTAQWLTQDVASENSQPDPIHLRHKTLSEYSQLRHSCHLNFCLFSLLLCNPI